MADRNTSIRANQFRNFSLLPEDIKATNSPSGENVLGYNSAQSLFEWKNTAKVFNSYYSTFTNSDLVSGKLTVHHSLGISHPLVIVYNNNDEVIIPDSITQVDNDTLEIDLHSFGTLSGTWKVRVGGNIAGETSRTINIDNSMTASDIQNLIDSVGRYIPPDVTITFQFADGTYSLDNRLLFNGFYGGGTIILAGNTSESNATDLHTTQSVHLDFSSANSYGIHCRYTQVLIRLTNLKITANTSGGYYAVQADNSTVLVEVLYSYLLGNSDSSGGCFRAFYCPSVRLVKTYLSNASIGIDSDWNSHIVSRNNDDTGTPPKYALRAYNGAVIAKSGATQPSGSVTNENSGDGGVIR